MNVQSAVEDAKSRAQQIRERGQKVASVSLDSFKQANQIIVDRSQSLFSEHKATSKDLFESAKFGFSKARADGFKAMLSAPVGYLPPRDKWYSLLNDTRSAFSDASGELVKIAKSGYDAATRESAPAKAKKVARKATTKAKKTARKATTRATKATKSAASKLEV